MDLEIQSCVINGKIREYAKMHTMAETRLMEEILNNIINYNLLNVVYDENGNPYNYSKFDGKKVALDCANGQIWI